MGSGTAAAGGLSTRPTASNGADGLRVNTSIPRWLMRVWPAIALTGAWRPIEMLALLVGPGGRLPLPAVLSALGASGERAAREHAAQEGAPRPSPAQATASGSQPKPGPVQRISDLAPDALKMLLLALGSLALSYIVVRYGGGGGGRAHRHG